MHPTYGDDGPIIVDYDGPMIGPEIEETFDTKRHRARRLLDKKQQDKRKVQKLLNMFTEKFSLGLKIIDAQAEENAALQNLIRRLEKVSKGADDELYQSFHFLQQYAERARDKKLMLDQEAALRLQEALQQEIAQWPEVERHGKNWGRGQEKEKSALAQASDVAEEIATLQKKLKQKKKDLSTSRSSLRHEEVHRLEEEIMALQSAVTEKTEFSELLERRRRHW